MKIGIQINKFIIMPKVKHSIYLMHIDLHDRLRNISTQPILEKSTLDIR